MFVVFGVLLDRRACPSKTPTSRRAHKVARSHLAMIASGQQLLSYHLVARAALRPHKLAEQALGVHFFYRQSPQSSAPLAQSAMTRLMVVFFALTTLKKLTVSLSAGKWARNADRLDRPVPHVSRLQDCKSKIRIDSSRRWPERPRWAAAQCWRRASSTISASTGGEWPEE
jgi:hypothetical protein